MSRSFRDRLLSMAMNGQSSKLHPVFEDAASACKTKEAAMAFGYLMGKEDADKELPSIEPLIYDSVVSAITQCFDDDLDPEYTAKLIFGLVYKWLDKIYENAGYYAHHEDDCGVRWHLAKACQHLVKPGVINPPFTDRSEQ
jgi:hypothetical protein